MRPKAARVCLLAAVVWFMLGAFVLGNAPEWFIVSAVLAVVAALLGARFVRVSGAALAVVSIAVAVGEYQAAETLKARARRIQEQAPDKGPRGDLFRQPNHRPARGAAGRFPLPSGRISRRASEAGRWAD